MYLLNEIGISCTENTSYVDLVVYSLIFVLNIDLKTEMNHSTTLRNYRESDFNSVIELIRLNTTRYL